MTDDNKNEYVEEANRLKAIYEQKKLEYRMKGEKLSQDVVAEKMKMTQGAVGHYLNGRSALNLSAAIQFAELFDVAVADFSPRLAKTLEGDNFRVASLSGFKSAPVLNYVQAGEFCQYFDDAITGERLPYNAEKHGDNCYWVIIEGDSMTPDFTPKDLVLINPDRQPNAGDYVIALMDGEKATTFKRYRPRGYDEATGKEYYQLVPTNELYPVIDSRFTDFTVCGVAVELKKALV